MSKRTLKRQLNLFQVIMLGTAGTLGSGIFVLTGLAAEVAGPMTFLAIFIGGFLSFSIALNYSELATIYPETGGAMTYVREAWGKGLLSFLIGSMDSISSTFYCALSAVGFAYSLSVFFPNIPIIPVAIAVIIIFVILNILGVTNVGNIQIVMGGCLIFAFAVYIIAGFVSPHGFQPAILFPDGKMFATDSFWGNTKILMRTIALIYAVYVGFEVIADDAEEVKNPSKTIPVAILISLLIITLVYSLTVLVTLGTVPWQSVAGSNTALTDAIKVFLPGWGVTIIGIAGMVGALTSINSSMLSATRETFTLSRDGAWPKSLSRLNSSRVPYMAILFIGIVSILITVIGVVDFLSYITSAGYLFVLLFSNMAMIQLHRKYPTIHRPFKAPLFPLTPILASLTCIIVIVYSDIDALLFTAGIILLFAVYYYGRIGLQLWNEAHKRDLSPGRWRIILPITTPGNADGLLKVGSLLAEAEKDMNMCLLTVLPTTAQMDQQISGDFLEKIKSQRHAVLEKFIHYAVDRNVPMYTKMVTDLTFEDGIINEIKNDNNVKLLLLKWPGIKTSGVPYHTAVKRLRDESGVSIGVLYDRGIKQFQNIMVPVGGGFHSRLAIHLANDIAMQEGSHVDYFRVIPEKGDEETSQDQISLLQEIVMTELGENPANATLRLVVADSVQNAVIHESETNDYDLTIIGSADMQIENGSLFGPVSDMVAENSQNSVLIVHRHDSAAASWLRQQLKHYQKS
ncbi:MAG: amino acid permease [Anaerolineaceae bacterium]|jgi:amino acid transporter/nucleotide-binding universal stress UspA family protein|nr:MAG: amino acid permease [Anaerolineaceae bacterium]